MKNYFQRGFVMLEVVVGVLLLAIATLVALKAYKTKHPTAKSSQSSVAPKSATPDDPNTPPLKLKSIGFNLDYYNPATGLAGDVKFNHYNLFASEIVGVFGQHDPRSTDPNVRNPQPTYVLAEGTKVRSLIDGVVADVKTLYSGDSTIMVTADGGMGSFIYETEHVINVQVKKGDKVKGGQIIAEVSPRGAPGPGIGILDIGILHPHSDGSAGHVCPYQYMDDSIKDDVNRKLTALYKSWNDYIGKTVYDYGSFVSPGCVTEDWVKG